MTMKKYGVDINLLQITGQLDLAKTITLAMRQLAQQGGDMRDYQMDVTQTGDILSIEWTEWPEEAKAIFKRQAA